MTKQLKQNSRDYSDVICGLHFETLTLIVCQRFVYIDAIYGLDHTPFVWHHQKNIYCFEISCADTSCECIAGMCIGGPAQL